MSIPAGAHWIRFPRFIGDAVMMHQAAAPLRAAGLPLVAWGPAFITELFEGSAGYVGAVGDPVDRKLGVREAWRLMARHRPASLLNLSKSHRSLLGAALARVPRRVACAEGGGRALATYAAAFAGRPGTSLERYQRMVAHAFPELSPTPNEPFRPRPDALQRQAEQASALGLTGRYVALSVGAASYSKRPGIELMTELAARARADGFGCVLLGGAMNDAERAEAVRERAPWALDITMSMGLAQRAAWLVGASAVLAGDTGLGHLAAAAAVPTVVLFGPTRPSEFAPQGQRLRILRKEGLDCLECGLHVCPLADHPCMNAFDADGLWRELTADIPSKVAPWT